MPMYEAKYFDRLLGTQGFSDALLKNHFSLYQGYVKATNQLLEELGALSQASCQTMPHFAELKRRLGWEWNGMRLHEVYFGGMRKGGAPPSPESELAKQITADFGSHEAWSREFKATGTIRGIGWTALYYDAQADRLFNAWIGEHDAGHLAGLELVLIMDVFEHAYLTDYGTKRADYIEAYFRSLDWEEAESRFRQARISRTVHAE